MPQNENLLTKSLTSARWCSRPGVLCMLQGTDTDISLRSQGGDPTQQSSLMGAETDEDLDASGGR